MNSLLFWNFRGARKKEASLYLKEIVTDHDVCFVGLMETKLSSIERKDVDSLIGRDWDYFHFLSWVAMVYGSKCHNEKRSSWNLIEVCMKDSGPTVVGEDFNCFVRPSYTWCNNMEGSSRIWERLDRCLHNTSALHLVPYGKVKDRTRVASDHGPIMYSLDTEKINRSKVIRFEDTWRDLYKLKDALKREILELQIKEASGSDFSCDDLFNLRRKIYELNVTLRRLAIWWNQRAKTRWQEEGDSNLKFFHNYALASWNATWIRQIMDANNTLVEEDDQIEQVFLQFFEKKWRYKTCDLTGWPCPSEK
ncbi:uncharacterized protein LOC114579277 [Dendrobium catenatum]|uniref:uncharacterized protein LOC114579277 n=1 Tax=Dendrobium catenatum TaxID=906689 RepID=UPI00109F3857|nr:uncharacterized protein LOC114579277 [Dendrobium catenatum]